MRAATAFLAVMVLTGCAHPHRKSESYRNVHSFEKFDPALRPDNLISREEWYIAKEVEKGGAFFLLTDPALQSMCVKHINPSDIGGSSWMMIGPFSITVDSNAPAIVKNLADGVGSVVGTAVGTAAKTASPVPPLRLPFVP